MSANIEFNEKKQSYSFVGNVGKDRKNVAWHGLGQEVTEPMTAAEAIELCNANFNVGSGRMIHVSNEMIEAIRRGDPINHLFSENDIVENAFCTYREDNGSVLGIVGNRYEIVQNAEAFKFIDDITGIGSEHELCKGAYIETAGILGKGERMFVTAKVPNCVRIDGSNDVIEDYIMFTNSHDGTGAVTACFTPVRVVCNNTLNAALKNCYNKVCLRHTANVKVNLQNAARVMHLHSTYMEQFQETLKHLATQKVTKDYTKKLVSQLLLTDVELSLFNKANGKIDTIDEISSRRKNQYHKLERTIDEGVGQEFSRGTKYWLYNGVTSYITNTMEFQSEEKRYKAILSSQGYGNKLQQNALDMLLTV